MGRRRDALEGPALGLSGSLRASGHHELAALLAEVIPDSSVVRSDDHRPFLRERLQTVAEHPHVPAQLREQAAHLAAVAANPVIAIGRVGTMWIAWCADSDGTAASSHREGSGEYDVSWQADRDDEDLYEDGPGFNSLDDALDWGRSRTDAIIVRPAWDESQHYWAGTAQDTRGFPPLGEPPTR